MRRRWLLGLVGTLFIGGCNWAIDARRVLSDGEVFTGKVNGGTDRGSMMLSNGKGTECLGEYAKGIAFLNCSDGETAQLQYVTMRIGSGYGFGTTSRGRGFRSTFGMSEEEGAKYLSPAVAGGGGGGTPPSSHKGASISRQGHIVTNAHVVNGCNSVTVQQPGGIEAAANVVATDGQNDLALLQTGAQPPAIATLRGGRPIRPGEAVVAYGFPLTGAVSSSGVLTNGMVNALSGGGDDTRFLQTSAPIQPGNSGGPLLDMTAAVVGVTSQSLSTNSAARHYGATPQNVNFAIKAEVVRTFLSTTGVTAESSAGGRELSAPDVGERARAFTVHIVCKG